MGIPVYVEREQQEPRPKGCGFCFGLEKHRKKFASVPGLVSRVAYPNTALCYLPYVELLC
jgi:hypothetical protein